MIRDVVVIGAGPAGAAAALLLAEHGLDVVVLERAALPRRRIVCGEYLSPEAGRLLDRLGVLKTVDAAGAAPLAGMRITAPDGTTVVGRYRAVGGWQPYRHALGVSRTTLDGALAERLRSAPIELREHTRVVDVHVEASQVVGVRAESPDGSSLDVRARVVIGADGRASVVAQRLGCRHPHRRRRLALITYVSGLADCHELGEIFVDPPDYAILNPVAPDRVNLGLVVPLDHAAPWSGRLEDFLAARVRQLPHLARRLAGATRVAPIHALGPLAHRVEPPRVGGVLLIGDAAGFYDPFTGEGVFTALRSAELATDTVARALRTADVSAASLATYQQSRREAFGGKERVTRALQLIVGHRRLANLACRILTKRPAALDALLGVIGDYIPPSALPSLLLHS